MKKFFSILLAFSLLQVGFAYAADTTTATLENRDYIFGLSRQSEVNLNQVLFLLAGKDGEPGAAGRDGIDGLNGLDGINGKDGINGINGVDGINGRDGLNGRDGATGATGATGAAGRDGRDGRDASGGVLASSESFTAYSNGKFNILACTESATVTLRPKYTGEDFVFENARFKDVSDRCGSGTKDVTLYFKVRTGTLNSPASPAKYVNNDIIKCVYQIPVLSGVGNPPVIEFTASNTDTTCSTFNNPSATFRFNDIYTADFTNRVGFEIYER